MSLIFLYTEESIKEITDKLKTKSFYIGTNGKIAFSADTDTARFMVNNLISDVA